MEERSNSFKMLEAKWEAGLPPELERRISSQTTNMAVFGRVVELFMPNALETVVQMIGGSGDTGPQADFLPGRRPEPDAWPDWRTPPGKR
ncbi:MAG: hypothetical protein EP344_05345 [Bacteroidetes bacterium]|nr:MAG: hypothetical protein EP344_05345 [Bacteroidota bacterium]